MSNHDGRDKPGDEGECIRTLQAKQPWRFRQGWTPATPSWLNGFFDSRITADRLWRLEFLKTTFDLRPLSTNSI